MKLFPAIDLKDNKCVRLSRGKDESSVVFNENPVDQAIYFEQQGCKRLHLVDLDSAFGRLNINSKTIKEIRKAISIPIQMGGGIRSKDYANSLFNLYIDYLIIGSYSITNVNDVLDLAKSFSNRVYVALDILNHKLMIRGWRDEAKIKTDDLLKKYNPSNIRGYVLTDINNDGMLNGLDIDLINYYQNLTNKNLVVGGGLTSYIDLKKLNKLSKKNLEGVIAGKSFYIGNIDLKHAQKILDKNA